MVHIVMSKRDLDLWWEDKFGPAIVTHDAQGKLTRQGAMIEARKLWGDLGTISSDGPPFVVWCIGQHGRTLGRGNTWEAAIAQSRARKASLDARRTVALKRELEDDVREIE